MAVSQCEQKRGKRNKGEMKLKRNKLWTIVLAGTLFMTACTPSQKNNNSSVAGTEAVSGIQGQSGETSKTAGTEEKNIIANPSSLFEDLKVTTPLKGMTHTNPIMTQRFGADPYAMEYNGRVYFYMTADVLEYSGDKVKDNTYGQINQINVVSTADMVNFTDHGSIRVAGSRGAAKWARNSWAPAACWKNIDGKDKFFLYFANSGGGIGVLTADSPIGPFEDPIGKALISPQTENCSDVLWLFDPAVLVDDDGRAYLYFGGGVPQGKEQDPQTARVVELGADMISLAGVPQHVNAPYLFEDSGIHKYNGKYYYTYCSNWNVDQEGKDKYGMDNAQIISMVSDSPMGPFTFKEVILNNPGQTFYNLYGNNHHCVFQFKDRWYITYHARILEKNMGILNGYRSTNIDSFEMGEDGTIGKIKMTFVGREQLSYVNPYEDVPATTIATQGGIEPVAADIVAANSGSGNMSVGAIDSGDFIRVQGVDFEDGAPGFSVVARNTEGTEGMIQIRVDDLEGPVLGYLPLGKFQEKAPTTTKFETYEAVMDECVTGVHDLYFIFYGSGYEINSWKFMK